MTAGTIGKFQVLSKISQGGMADIYRCRLRGIGGFEKIVALKRIRADRASDPDFVNMFLDEARLTGSLSHPNIVQVFEIGEVDGAPYIAMEYVGGPTLAQILRQLRPIQNLQARRGVLLRILADVCAGLHHAHNATGPAGEPLGLVHRDVSPQNILVSRQGVPKLLDFGVAKARGRLTETKAGTLKGKLRYMAPEQLSGGIDHRADVFALGVCLFEATTGQSPYGPDHLDEVTLFGRILSGQSARPSELIPDYPPKLEDIVLSALDADPTKRCPSVIRLQESLEEFLGDAPPSFGARAVRDLVEELFPDPVGDNAGAAAGPGTAAAPGTVPTRDLIETALERVTPLPAMQPSRRPRRPGRRWALAATTVTLAMAGVMVGLGNGWFSRATAVVPPPASLASAPARAPSIRSPQTFSPLAVIAPVPTHGLPTAPPPAAPAGKRRAGSTGTTTSARNAADARAGQRPGLAQTPATAGLAHATTTATEIHSAIPGPQVWRPNLPRRYSPTGPGDLEQMLARVEDETIKAGCSPQFSRGVTAPLYQALAGQSAAVIFPAAMYYFIVREAALGREKRIAAQELGKAHASGVVQALVHLVEKRRR